MKNTKKVCAVLLSAMIMASFASCGNTSNQTTENSSGTSSASESASGSVAAEPGEVTLPLSEEPVTLTYFMGMNSNAEGIISDYNENEFFQELEKRTNVHIEWECPSSADSQTSFNLMIASNQLPDLVGSAATYANGVEAAVDDGYYLDLTELVPQYMPNYNAFRQTDPTLQKMTVTDSGRIPVIYVLYNGAQGPFLGLQIRQDWLDDLGLDMPATYDDWTNVLTAFKEEKGAYAPLSLQGHGFEIWDYGMQGGFGVCYTFQLDETGKVNYGPVMDGWKDYLTQMHDWYEAGLIDPDFMAATSPYLVDTALVVTGKAGAWTSMYSLANMYESSSEDPNMNVMPAPAPTKEGGEIHIGFNDVYAGLATAVSTTCENPEIAMRWMDYLFTDEGMMLANYGVEGDTYTIADDGSVQYTDKIMNNDQYSFLQAMSVYLCPPATVPNLCDWQRENLAAPEKDLTSYDVWSHDTSWTMPSSLSLTADESVERATIIADVETFVREQTTQMITGIIDIESNWDTYVSTVKSMNIDRAIEITQAAYDRYLAR